jgi:hypothetical protein
MATDGLVLNKFKNMQDIDGEKKITRSLMSHLM